LQEHDRKSYDDDHPEMRKNADLALSINMAEALHEIGVPIGNWGILHLLEADRQAAQGISEPVDEGPLRFLCCIGMVRYVGEVLAVQSEMKDLGEAIRWAMNHLGADESRFYHLATAADLREELWLGMDSLSARCHIIQRFSDGWRLIRAFAHTLDASSDDTADALKWGRRILRMRRLPAPDWQPGPTTYSGTGETWFG